MANLPFLDLYDHVIPYLPGAETSVVDLQIRRTLKDFFRRTTLWREDVPVTILPDQTLYALVPSTPIARVAHVMRVGHGPHAIDLAPVPEHYRMAPGYVDTRAGWWVQNLPYIHLRTTEPTAVVSCALTLTVEPGVLEFPEWVLNNHVEIVSAGILAHMMSMPGKPWTQLDLAGVHWKRYSSGVLAERAQLRDGSRPNASTMTGPRFGA